MGKQRLLTIYQVVSFLGVLSIATSKDSLLVNDIDYGSLYSRNFKEKCSDYPEFRPCHYWKTFVEEANDGDKVPKNQDNCTSQAKDNTDLEILLEVPYLSPERFLDKRFTVFRRKNPYAQGYKRGPGFRSWGGKRGQPYLEKKTKFTSWGGKRDGQRDNSLVLDFEDGEPEEKRTNLGNWGGKREGFGAQDKRTKFRSWGGKRNEDYVEGPGKKDVETYGDHEGQDKRTKFRSWGGKRSEDYVEGPVKKDVETPISYDQMYKKFWNGHGGLYMSEPLKKHVPKRPQFQSWGGKRSPRPWGDALALYYPGQFNLKKFLNGDEKRKFSSWGGKREGSEGNLGKRFELNVDGGKIPSKFKTPQIFQNWGGKRGSQEEQEEQEEEEEEAGHVFGDPEVSDDEREKRQDPEKFPHSNFNSWGGKRGEGKETGVREGVKR